MLTGRRRLLVGVASAMGLGGASVAARAQDGSRSRRIGYLSLRAGPGPLDEEFFAALRSLGYVEGRNLAVVYRCRSDPLRAVDTISSRTLGRTMVELQVHEEQARLLPPSGCA